MKPLQLNPGPHLFIDDFLIAEQTFLSRTVNNPDRLSKPIITGGKEGDENFQPYLTVIRDPETKKFRIWYNTAEHMRQSHIGYLESEDGINWNRPHRILKDPQEIKFGVAVIDRGSGFSEPAQRFVLGFYYDNGLKIAGSRDGLDWKMITTRTVLRHDHDIISIHYDPIRDHYLAICSMWVEGDNWEGRRRIPHMSVSPDLLNWEDPWPVFTPKIGVSIEKGETQFYAMSGVLRRGDLLIGLLKVLRDDLNATPGKTAKEMGDMDRKAAGIGYTVLAWSRDGRSWQRDHEPFLENDPVPGKWDHAMAWGDEQIVVDNETYIYYVGYARGHKVARFDERQVGLAQMPLDRYVSREADINTATLITKPLLLNGNTITVNALVVGHMRVRLIDENGLPIDNFNWADIAGDQTHHIIGWNGDLKAVSQKPVRLEFRFQNAQLYGFYLN